MQSIYITEAREGWVGGGVLEIGKGEGVNSSSCSKFIEYNVDWILISSNTLLLNIITQNFQPLKKSTNQKKKYSTTSNDTSQRSATHSRRIQIRAARRKKDRCFHYLAGVLHCYNVFLLVSRVCLFQFCLLVENVNKYKVTCHLAYQSLQDGSLRKPLVSDRPNIGVYWPLLYNVPDLNKTQLGP